MQYAWFIWSLIILAIWLVIFLMRKDVRQEMLIASLWTTPLGLTEPLFVLEYWNPPSFFKRAQKIFIHKYICSLARLIWSVVHLLPISGFRNKLLVVLNLELSHFAACKGNRFFNIKYQKTNCE